MAFDPRVAAKNGALVKVFLEECGGCIMGFLSERERGEFVLCCRSDKRSPRRCHPVIIEDGNATLFSGKAHKFLEEERFYCALAGVMDCCADCPGILPHRFIPPHKVANI